MLVSSAQSEISRKASSVKQLALGLSILTAAVLLTIAVPTAKVSAQQPAPHLDIPKNIRPYFVAFLVKGDKYSEEQTPEAMEVLRNHLAYIKRETELKKYVLSGPMTDEGNIAGILIIDAPTIEEARNIVAADPAILAGRFKAELHSAMYAEIKSNAQY